MLAANRVPELALAGEGVGQNVVHLADFHEELLDLADHRVVLELRRHVGVAERARHCHDVAVDVVPELVGPGVGVGDLRELVDHLVEHQLAEPVGVGPGSPAPGRTGLGHRRCGHCFS